MAKNRMDPARLKRIAAMLDDGASFKEITDTLHVSFETLKKYFPGRSWSHRECIEHGVLVKNMNTAIKKATATHYLSGAK